MLASSAMVLISLTCRFQIIGFQDRFSFLVLEAEPTMAKLTLGSFFHIFFTFVNFFSNAPLTFGEPNEIMSAMSGFFDNRV